MANAKQATKNNAPATTEQEFYSLKDLGYKQAATSDTLTAQARYAMGKIKGFPTEIDDASKKELIDGYRLRYADINEVKSYARVNGHYEPLTADNKKAIEVINLTVDYVMSYSQQQFGRLKAENNALYEVLKPERERINDYCTGKLRDLKNKAAQLVRAATTHHRGPTDNFDVALKKMMDNIINRCTNAASRGDATADKERLARAKIAFWAAWNKE